MIQNQLNKKANTGFDEKLIQLINVNTMSSKSGEAGRPQSETSALTDSGAETRARGSNIEKGGDV